MEGLVTGRIVYYVFDGIAAAAVNQRRTTSAAILERINAKSWPLGAQAHIGSDVTEGDTLPAMVVKALDGDAVNLKVFLDGSDVFWASSVAFDDGARQAGEASGGYRPGTWHWMFEKQSTRYAPPSEAAILKMIEDGLKASLPTDVDLRAWVTAEVGSAMTNARMSQDEIERFVLETLAKSLATAGTQANTAYRARLSEALDVASGLLNAHGHQGAWVQLTSSIKRILEDWPEDQA